MKGVAGDGKDRQSLGGVGSSRVKFGNNSTEMSHITKGTEG